MQIANYPPKSTFCIVTKKHYTVHIFCAIILLSFSDHAADFFLYFDNCEPFSAFQGQKVLRLSMKAEVRW